MPNFRRAGGAVSAMMIIGAASRRCFPRGPPWPAESHNVPAAVPRLGADSPVRDPAIHATWPTVAFTAGVVSSVLPGRSVTALGMVVVLAVAGQHSDAA